MVYRWLLLKQRRSVRRTIIAMEPLLSPDSKRIYVVDALRGFAVMAIMLLHFLEHFIYNSYPVASSPVMDAANQQFVTMPDYVLDELGKKYGFAYLRREDPSHSTVRFCTSWATREEDVRELMADIGRLC